MWLKETLCSYTVREGVADSNSTSRLGLIQVSLSFPRTWTCHTKPEAPDQGKTWLMTLRPQIIAPWWYSLVNIYRCVVANLSPQE